MVRGKAWFRAYACALALLTTAAVSTLSFAHPTQDKGRTLDTSGKVTVVDDVPDEAPKFQGHGVPLNERFDYWKGEFAKLEKEPIPTVDFEEERCVLCWREGYPHDPEVSARVVPDWSGPDGKTKVGRIDKLHIGLDRGYPPASRSRTWGAPVSARQARAKEGTTPENNSFYSELKLPSGGDSRSEQILKVETEVRKNAKGDLLFRFEENAYLDRSPPKLASTTRVYCTAFKLEPPEHTRTREFRENLLLRLTGATDAEKKTLKQNIFPLLRSITKSDGTHTAAMEQLKEMLKGKDAALVNFACQYYGDPVKDEKLAARLGDGEEKRFIEILKDVDPNWRKLFGQIREKTIASPELKEKAQALATLGKALSAQKTAYENYRSQYQKANGYAERKDAERFWLDVVKDVVGKAGFKAEKAFEGGHNTMLLTKGALSMWVNVQDASLSVVDGQRSDRTPAISLDIGEFLSDLQKSRFTEGKAGPLPTLRVPVHAMTTGNVFLASATVDLSNHEFYYALRGYFRSNFPRNRDAIADEVSYQIERNPATFRVQEISYRSEGQ